jgi:hypothetical protein
MKTSNNSFKRQRINYTNAPGMDGVTASSGGFGAGVWATVDITPLLTGNGSHDIGLTTESGTAFSLVSPRAGPMYRNQ